MQSWIRRPETPFLLSRAGGFLAVVTFPVSVSLSQLGLFLAFMGWLIWQRKSRSLIELPGGTWRMPLVFPLELKLGLSLYGALFLSLLIHAAGAGGIEASLAIIIRGFRSELKDVFLITMAFWTLAYSNSEEGRKQLYRWLWISITILVGSGFFSIFSRYRLSRYPYHMIHGWVDSFAARFQHHAGTLFTGTPLEFHIYMPIGFMGTHLTYAALLGFIIPFLLFGFIHPVIQKPRALFERPVLLRLGSAILALTILILNNGRSIFLGLVVVLIFAFYFMIRVYWKKRVLRLLPLGAAVLLLGGLVVVAMPHIHGRLYSILSALTGRSKHTDWQRTFVWQGTLDMIERNPVFGVGPGGYDKEINRTILRFSQTNPRLWYFYEVIQRGHAHNDLFHMQAIGGLPAAFLYVFFFTFLIHRLFHRSKYVEDDFLKWGVIILFVSGLFQCYFQDDEVLLPFWFFTAMALRGINGPKNDSPAEVLPRNL